ncbi:MAG: MarR family transcriptional regulator [Actinobacteria bacterium]|nr:MarR family transcriptional regulator [Actinomycetota bacterium]
METTHRESPPLLPLLRSRQQADLLLYVLTNPAREVSLTELGERLRIPYASVHREVERAQQAGIIETRYVGRTRVVRANPASPYFESLSELLVRAFGPPQVLAEELERASGISAAYIFGSWAARYRGDGGRREVGDIDVLILGHVDRDEVYEAAARAERRLGRPVQVTIRRPDWLETGSDSFHATVTAGAMVDVPLTSLSSGSEDGEFPP